MSGWRRLVAPQRSSSAHLWRADGKRLLRRYRDGEAAVDAFCEDYAFLVWGLLELFQASGEGRWLDHAVELTEVQTELFFDDRDGGWFSTTGDDPSVLLRLKEDYDGAEPGAASVTVHNLLVLAELTGDRAHTDRASRTLERYGTQIGHVVRVMPFMVSNIALWHAPKCQIVVAGPRQSAATARTRSRGCAPVSAVCGQSSPAMPSVTGPAACRAVAVARRDAAEGGPASAYVCRDFTCQAPVADPVALDRQLDDVAAPRRIVQS